MTLYLEGILRWEVKANLVVTTGFSLAEWLLCVEKWIAHKLKQTICWNGWNPHAFSDSQRATFV